MVKRAGFVLCNSAGTLFGHPGQTPGTGPKIGAPRIQDAGFRALLLKKNAEDPTKDGQNAKGMST